MTENETIKIATHCLGVQAEQEVCEECPVYLDGGIACREAARVAIEALKEVQQYREIGTVKECREAVEKQRTKKTHIVTNEFLGGTSYVCPNCGAEMMLIDRNRIQWGRMQKYCGCCGQAIDENLEGLNE